MKFEQINPYLRFVRMLTLNSRAAYTPLVPYDARLFYAAKGSSTIKAHDKLYDMYKGCVLIIPPGVKYHLQTPEHHITYIAVNFDYTNAKAHLKTPIPPDAPQHFNKNGLLAKAEFSDLTQFNSPLYLT
ncbi:MAG: hypothetical protein IJ365_00280 [Clostridia bacterium]|nr:hypothetical protein [Clostridia bacterium]